MQDPDDFPSQSQTPMGSSTDMSVETGSSGGGGGVGSWIGSGLSDLSNLARSIKDSIPPAIDGIAVAIHRSAMNVAAEFSQMEREAGMEATRWREEQGLDGEEGDDESDGEVAVVLPLPWEMLTTKEDQQSYAVDDELKMKILGLSLEEDTFKAPFGTSDRGDLAELDSYLDDSRVHLIRRLLGIDENLGKIHAKLSGRSEVKETIFWKNYFHRCDMVRAEHEVGAELIDLPTTCDADGRSRPSTPPPTSEVSNELGIKGPTSPPKVRSVGDLVLVGCDVDDLDDLADVIALDSLE